MNKQDLINKVTQGDTISKAVVTRVVNAFLKEVRQTIVQGEEVRLPELGIISHIVRKAHNGYNPATGERIDVPECLVPHIAFSSSITKDLNKT